MTDPRIDLLRALVRDIPDFPKPGILFKDITPLLADPRGFNHCLDLFEDRFQGAPLDAIVGMESRGFIFGAALAARYSHHFALETFVKLAPKKLHRPLEIFADIFTVAACGLLFHASYKFILDEFDSGSIAFYIGRLGIPGGWAEIIIPVTFVLIAYHAMMGIFRPEEKPEGHA